MANPADAAYVRFTETFDSMIDPNTVLWEARSYGQVITKDALDAADATGDPVAQTFALDMIHYDATELNEFGEAQVLQNLIQTLTS
jgi:hypothetical protein